MNGLSAVTDLAKYIQGELPDVKVFKFEKPVNYTGVFVCLNYLSVKYGPWANTSGIVNVNVHVPDKSSQLPDTKQLQTLAERVTALLPHRNTATEDDERELIIKGKWYCLESDSNLIKDTDGTHFINLRVQVTFTD